MREQPEHLHDLTREALENAVKGYRLVAAQSLQAADNAGALAPGLRQTLYLMFWSAEQGIGEPVPSITAD